jgi:hypothetical protein
MLYLHTVQIQSVRLLHLHTQSVALSVVSGREAPFTGVTLAF